MSLKADQFSPYINYLENSKEIDQFSEMAEVSFSQSRQSLFNLVKSNFEKEEVVLNITDIMKGSYSVADVREIKKEMPCRWLTINEFAEKTKMTTSEVNNLISQNKLGTTCKNPKSNEKMVIWPQSYKNKTREDLPLPGRNYKIIWEYRSVIVDKLHYVNKVNKKKDLENRLYRLHEKFSSPKKLQDHFLQHLYRSCFLLKWTNFETFIKNVLTFILNEHPELILGSKTSDQNAITYKQLYDFSKKLESMSSLKEKLIEKEIFKQDGIYGMIDFLRKKLKFKEDPYVVHYQFKGTQQYTSFSDLIELKDVRNVLIHQTGTPKPSFFSKYKKVPKRNSKLFIDYNYYLRADLILRSIAFNLSYLISYKIYTLEIK